MRINRRLVDNYVAMIETLGARAKAALAEVLAEIDYGDPSIAIPLIKAAMVEICGKTAEAAAQLSATLYEALYGAMVGESLVVGLWEGYAAGATDEAVAAIVQKLVDGEASAMESALFDRIAWEAKRAAGDSMMSYGGKGVRFARVPSGGETCEYCMMLASRGFVYKSRADAMGHYHANCRCAIVPGTSGTTVQGYDPDEIYRTWKDMSQH